MKRFLCTTLWGCLISLSASSGYAEENPEDMLKAVDKVIGSATDQYVVFEMVTEEPGKAERRMTFQATIKGFNWRMIEFLAPGDVKGTRILVRSTSEMYIYLPAYKKIRRIASHVREQGFMGSAWDHDEFSLAVFGNIFAAESVIDHGETFTMILKRRPKEEFLYPKIEVDVRRNMMHPIEIRYYNDANTKVKTESRSDFTCNAGLCTPKHVLMVDHSRNDIKTRMTLLDWKVNRGIPDSFFTTRALQRGN